MNCEVEIENKLSKGQPTQLLPIDQYDKIIIAKSAGKDSMACVFHILDLGIPPEKIELWHQSVDGGGQQYTEFLDWPITESYIEAVGQLYGIKTTYQWRSHGIYGEMLRQDSLTGDVYHLEDGKITHLPTTRGNMSTRRRWPAMSADLRTRWCSAYAKIDVFARVLSQHPDYQGSKEQPLNILVVSGERREESANRAKYNEVEIHRCSNKKRMVHTWRPVIDWSERKIWDAFEQRRILPHPAYLLGWNRTSCFGCIFSTADLWAMMREIAPDRFDRLVQVEKELNHTIDPRLSLTAKADLGSLRRLPQDARLSQWVQLALSRSFRMEDLVMDQWELPAGAMRGAAGGPN